MINEIIDGICLAINAEFGDAYEIYTEEIKQGLKEPCFSILCLNPTVEQFLGKRYFRTNQFCIHYFSKADSRSECHEVAERLIDCLETITVDGDLVRGNSLHSEINDGVLSFFVNYDLFTYKQEVTEGIGGIIEIRKEEPMETMKHETDVKG